MQKILLLEDDATLGNGIVLALNSESSEIILCPADGDALLRPSRPHRIQSIPCRGGTLYRKQHDPSKSTKNAEKELSLFHGKSQFEPQPKQNRRYHRFIGSFRYSAQCHGHFYQRL